jgi:hypothetical protein
MPTSYPMPGQFMPSVATLKSWLRTRKSKSQNLPGIFDTVDYSTDTTWAMFSILVELAAFVFTIWGAWSLYLKNHSMLILSSAIIIVFLFIAFDILGIMLHGQDKPQKVELRNRIAISHDLIQKEVLYKQLNQITWREFMGFMMLIISSILKILAISVFFSKSGVPLLVILVLFYLVVIYIHGFHTGYWWAELTLNSKIKKEYQNFLDCHTKGVSSDYSVKNNHQVIFDSSVPMGNFNIA